MLSPRREPENRCCRQHYFETKWGSIRFRQGPKNFQTDISLYKVFSITERVKLRVNVNAFNGFNMQGRVNPNTTNGIQSLQTSYWTPRQIQMTRRLSF